MKFLAIAIFFICGQGVWSMYWQPMDPSKSDGSGCFIGGREGSVDLYVARKQIGNELVIGKAVLPWKSAYFPIQGREEWSEHYEILCGVNDKNWWGPYYDGNFPDNTVAGGKTGDGTDLYICRGDWNGSFIPGKLYKPSGCCYIPYQGAEHCLTTYAVLR